MAIQSDDRLGTEPVGKLLRELAVPAVAAQVVNVLYNIVDRMYIGHIPETGALALTGLGVASPILMLVAAFAQMVGAGGAPLASMQLGAGEREKTEKILGNALTALLGMAVILTILFSILKKPMLVLFGATENTISYAVDYIQIYLLGSVFVMLALGLNSYISCQGQAKIAMLSVVIGAVLNIILDPILIYGFGMGVKGAAIATITSQAVSALWIVRFLTSDRTVIRIRRSMMAIDPKLLGRMLALGLAPFIMLSTESLINIIYNRQLLSYGGDLYVGSMTILASIMQLIIIPLNGIGQGAMPLLSYNFGAGKNDRVMETFRKLLTVTVAASVAGCLLCVLFPGVFASFFSNDPELRGIVKQVLPIFIAGMGLFGVQMACQPTFVSLGQAKTSMFIALLRKVILLIPFAFLFPHFVGLLGVYLAEPAADILSASTSGLIFLFRHKKILEEGPARL